MCIVILIISMDISAAFFRQLLQASPVCVMLTPVQIRRSANLREREHIEMKHAAKQSTVTLVLNLCSILMLVASLGSFLFCAFSYRMMNRKEEERYDLSQYASQFLEGSSTLTDEIRAYAATGDPSFWNGYQNELTETMSRERGLEGL